MSSKDGLRWLGVTRDISSSERGGPQCLRGPRISKDGTHDEHPPARHEMRQVVRQALDVLARLLLEALHFEDLGDQHVVGLTDAVRARPPAA